MLLQHGEIMAQADTFHRIYFDVVPFLLALTVTYWKQPMLDICCQFTIA
jgi:hypothetical protein